ncbi:MULTISPECIES: PTS lactose/cellobiose transporter subunit IIA [Lacticaseibacillus]|jgi:PTS system cellobiose-specific IIA component|uniref:PTS lactose/cellobiose transporter subunit IIA n=1 Tax=Lacticaseibacillus TaxID=2759736 RepID=UPI00192BA712|nr:MULTISPECIES: PTS lactose/cellobiose transporter subunit IIA [Lacticaseibacillus]MCI2038442.1 PTS lactose/cellobiose transporter subunit IIA [Lactobacillus sp.]CAD7483389.1 PTS system N,N'-diacetylchitobiose-specific EIIA component [Lacticaseibacillus paracasei]
MNESEKQIMGLISSSGESRAKAFEALQSVRKHDYDKAHKLLQESKDLDVEAHNIQTKMIQQELSEGGGGTQISLLMVHAQDHYMTAQLSRDLIEEMIKIFEERDGEEKLS